MSSIVKLFESKKKVKTQKRKEKKIQRKFKKYKNIEERKRRSISRNGNGVWFRAPWGALGSSMVYGSQWLITLDVK